VTVKRLLRPVRPQTMLTILAKGVFYQCRTLQCYAKHRFSSAQKPKLSNLFPKISELAYILQLSLGVERSRRRWKLPHSLYLKNNTKEGIVLREVETYKELDSGSSKTLGGGLCPPSADSLCIGIGRSATTSELRLRSIDRGSGPPKLLKTVGAGRRNSQLRTVNNLAYAII
jgi:hypothetical protein